MEAEFGPSRLVSNAGTDDTLLMRMKDEQFTRVVEANLAALSGWLSAPAACCGRSVIFIGSWWQSGTAGW